MWDNAEVVVLLNSEGRVRAISRNEDEALIRNPIGMGIMESVHPDSQTAAEAAFRAALDGVSSTVLLCFVADDGRLYWSRSVVRPSPLKEAAVLVHSRRLPNEWGSLTQREREVIGALHEADMNPKRAARRLGISQHTLNAHRRSITKKCQLKSVGDFWIFVERCR